MKEETNGTRAVGPARRHADQPGILFAPRLLFRSGRLMSHGPDGAVRGLQQRFTARGAVTLGRVRGMQQRFTARGAVTLGRGARLAAALHSSWGL